jgi:hypothetical protein
MERPVWQASASGQDAQSGWSQQQIVCPSRFKATWNQRKSFASQSGWCSVTASLAAR